MSRVNPITPPMLICSEKRRLITPWGPNATADSKHITETIYINIGLLNA